MDQNSLIQQGAISLDLMKLLVKYLVYHQLKNGEAYIQVLDGQASHETHLYLEGLLSSLFGISTRRMAARCCCCWWLKNDIACFHRARQKTFFAAGGIG